MRATLTAIASVVGILAAAGPVGAHPESRSYVLVADYECLDFCYDLGTGAYFGHDVSAGDQVTLMVHDHVNSDVGASYEFYGDDVPRVGRTPFCGQVIVLTVPEWADRVVVDVQDGSESSPPCGLLAYGVAGSMTIVAE